MIGRGVRRIDAYWLAPAPADRLALLRILIGAFALGYLLIRGAALTNVSDFGDTQFDAVGVVNVLSEPLPAPLVRALLVLTVTFGVAFLMGWRYRVSGLLFALLLLWVTTYRNSWGQIFHTENLLVLHVLVLSLAPAADTRSLDARSGRTTPTAGPHPRYGWPLRLMAVITVIAYMIAGEAKLTEAGTAWVTDDVLRNQVAFDNLRKILLGGIHSPIGAALVQYRWIFLPLAALTIVVEIGAPLALLRGRIFGRSISLWWAITAWAFHLGIFAFMFIIFPYRLLGVAYLPFFAVERWRLWDRLARVERWRLRGTRSVASDTRAR